MGDRRGSSRSIGVVKQCAVYARGENKCVWCQRKLRAPHTDGGKDTVTATIDHYDCDSTNNDASNLLGACRTCNSYRHWVDMWVTYMAGRKQSVAEAEKRAKALLKKPLDYEAGRKLAEKWHPGRLEDQRRNNERYRMRKKGLLPGLMEFP